MIQRNQIVMTSYNEVQITEISIYSFHPTFLHLPIRFLPPIHKGLFCIYLLLRSD